MPRRSVPITENEVFRYVAGLETPDFLRLFRTWWQNEFDTNSEDPDLLRNLIHQMSQIATTVAETAKNEEAFAEAQEEFANLSPAEQARVLAILKGET
jgi:hypothetical protein